MPRPPILPTIDWKNVFDSGKDYETWLENAEFPENAERMETARKALELDAELVAALGAMKKRVHVVAIAEDWCGDVVRHAPALRKIEETADKVEARFIAREDSPDVFERFLTNGGEAIPKFIFLSQDFVECANWGPMPHACREVIARGKACGDVAAARQITGAMYGADPGLKVVMRELVECIDIASSTSPDPRAGILVY